MLKKLAGIILSLFLAIGMLMSASQAVFARAEGGELPSGGVNDSDRLYEIYFEASDGSAFMLPGESKDISAKVFIQEGRDYYQEENIGFEWHWDGDAEQAAEFSPSGNTLHVRALTPEELEAAGKLPAQRDVELHLDLFSEAGGVRSYVWGSDYVLTIAPDYIDIRISGFDSEMDVLDTDKLELSVINRSLSGDVPVSGVKYSIYYYDEECEITLPSGGVIKSGGEVEAAGENAVLWLERKTSWPVFITVQAEWTDPEGRSEMGFKDLQLLFKNYTVDFGYMMGVIYSDETAETFTMISGGLDNLREEDWEVYYMAGTGEFDWDEFAYQDPFVEGEDFTSEGLTITFNAAEIYAKGIEHFEVMAWLRFNGAHGGWVVDYPLYVTVEQACEVHDWTEWSELSPATAEEDGIEFRSCRVCDKIETRAIPRLSLGEPKTVAQIGEKLIYLGEDSMPDHTYTGIARDSEGVWWRVVNGEVDFSAEGVFQNENGWWYVKEGRVQFDYTGIRNNENGWWRIVNGKVDFSAEGVFQNENGWWYVKGGKVQFGYNGIRNNENGWWRIVRGKVDFAANGIFHNENGWWYVKGGKVDFGFNGTYIYKNKTWRIESGRAVSGL